jgi:NitT/TauT family transport system substrate-binding protein
MNTRKNITNPRHQVFISLVILIAWSLGACSQPSAPDEPLTLKFIVLPILDSLPMYVAEREGLFDDNKVAVEFIPVNSAPERDQLIAAGQADGMINEAVSTIFYNADQTQIQIVRFARTATPEQHVFSILASEQSGVTGVADLKGVPIGVSQGTVIEYLTDRLLENQGFTDQEISTVAVPNISDRLALLASGELSAGTLPEPPTSLAQQQGAMVIIDDTTYPEISFSVISFRKDIIDQYPDAIRGFLAAIESAVLRINSNPDQYSNLLVEKQLVPAPLAGSFEVPQYPLAGVPTQEQWADALAWTMEKGLNDVQVAYEESVTGAYLP